MGLRWIEIIGMQYRLDDNQYQIESGHVELSVCRRCGLLGLNRSTLNHKPPGTSAEDLWVMNMIDKE